MTWVSIDTETHLIDRANLAPRPVCISYILGEGVLATIPYKWDRQECVPYVDLVGDLHPEVRNWLKSDVILVGTNIAYDMAVLGAHWPHLMPLIFSKYERGQIHGVDLNQKLIDIASTGSADQGYSLVALARHYDLPVPDKTGPWRMEFASLDGVPVTRWPQGAIDYVLADAELPSLIYAQQLAYDEAWKAQTGHSILCLAGYEAYKQFALHLIACWGVKTNRARVGALRASLDTNLAKWTKRLIKAGLIRPDGTKDTKKAKSYMAHVMGDRTRATSTNQVALDKEACSASRSKLLCLYSEFSQASTLVSRVEDLAQGVDLPLQTRFNSLLETGRTSSSKPGPPLVGAQLQNMPRGLGARECLEPRPGHVYVLADYAGAESHSLGQVCIDKFGKSVMADKLNAGVDLHTWFAGVLMSKSYEDMAALPPDELKQARQNAKAANFGFPGGLGATRFVEYAWNTYRLALTEYEAKRLKAMWLAAFPEMVEYFAWVNASPETFRHGRSGRWRGLTTFCQRANSPFQELTATAAADALCQVQKACFTDRSAALWNSRAVLYTHDEIVLETPEPVCHEAAFELSKVMERVFNTWHPDCPTKAEPLITRVYSKQAKPVWLNGRLVPWEPVTTKP